MTKPLALAAFIAAVWAVGATGCTTSQGGTDVTSDPGEMRTDVDPIASRVPQLGDDFTVQWFGGTTGDDRAPGPSTYWVDALVAPSTGVADLVGDIALSPGTPVVGDDLAALVPDCAWERSDEIDESWGPTGWETHVWLCLEHEQVVLTLLGGN